MTIKYRFVTGEEVYVEVYGRLEKMMTKLGHSAETGYGGDGGNECLSLDCLSRGENFEDGDANPEERILKEVDKNILYGAILKLRPDEQDLIHSLYLTDKPMRKKQCADILGVTNDILQSKLLKIKTELRHIISEI